MFSTFVSYWPTANYYVQVLTARIELAVVEILMPAVSSPYPCSYQNSRRIQTVFGDLGFRVRVHAPYTIMLEIYYNTGIGSPENPVTWYLHPLGTHSFPSFLERSTPPEILLKHHLKSILWKSYLSII